MAVNIAGQTIAGQTRLYTDEHGTTHVQHLGAEHVVEGTTRVLMVPVGETVVIRHYRPVEGLQGGSGGPQG